MLSKAERLVRRSWNTRKLRLPPGHHNLALVLRIKVMEEVGSWKYWL